MSKCEESSFLEDNYAIYLSQISKIPCLSVEEEKELITKMKTDESAKKRVIEANLKLVIVVARKYYRGFLPLMDLIQEGNIGLYYATEHYNPDKNTRFSTYAYYNIRNFILNYIYSNSRQIKIPVSLTNETYRYREVVDKMRDTLGYYPSFEEIAKEMKLSVTRVKQIYSFIYDTKSANTSIQKDDGSVTETEFESFIEEDTSLEDTIFKHDLEAKIDYLIENSKLTDKEKFIIRKYYGLNTGKEMTFDKIGAECGVSRQAIHTIYKRALTKLITSKKLSYVTDYADTQTNTKKR